MALNKAKILYENIMRDDGADISYSGAEVDGFGYENAYDWRDYSLFRAAVGTTTLDAEVDADTDVDTAAVWVAARVAASVVVLQYESAPATFTTLSTFVIPAGTDTMLMVSFAEVTILSGRRLRWSIEAGAAVLDIRQLCAGVAMVNPIGQHVGHTPPNLTQGVVVTNVIAVNGSMIGRNFRRLERTDTIDWSPVLGAWVRETWEPFVTHARRNAFFYMWAPELWPLEVVMAAAESIVAPENISPTPRMRVSMPLRCLAARVDA